jgi:lipopolysaccharide/colanic/teichoic acid biosynthesis glycosyltransferase
MGVNLRTVLKRILDILLSGTLLIISFPIWALVSIAIIMESGGPIFIVQERIGKLGKIFWVLKFRSMDKKAHTECPASHAHEKDKRVTKIGHIIRKTAIDELPQLLSIFRGYMSFVGPRPMHPKETEMSGSKYKHYSDIPDFHIRTAITPGLTGLAQVYAPKYVPLEKKVKYDLLYVKNHNILLDLKIIFLSFWITFRGKWEKNSKKKH